MHIIPENVCITNILLVNILFLTKKYVFNTKHLLNFPFRKSEGTKYHI